MLAYIYTEEKRRLKLLLAFIALLFVVGTVLNAAKLLEGSLPAGIADFGKPNVKGISTSAPHEEKK